ncbi:MAG: AI-2E family transporter, partial [Bacteroidales bacterium]
MKNSQNTNWTGQRYFLARHITYSLLAVILFIYGLIIIRDFLYPIAFGFLLAYLIYPIANWVEKKGVPRILANLLTLVGVMGVLVALFLLAYQRISPFASEFPHLAESGIRNFSEMLSNIGPYFGFDKAESRNFIAGETSALLKSGTRYLQTLFEATTSTIVSIALLPVYIFMFLYYRTKFMYFLLMISGRPHRQEVVTILREISTVMVRYMSGVIIVVFILCFINSLGIYIIGLKYAIPMVVTSALFNFIPYFGTLIGG